MSTFLRCDEEEELSTLVRLAEQSVDGTRDAKKVRIDNLNRVYAYCLNNVDCRRTLLLEYFGEQYLSSQCKRHVQTRCDNCCSVAQTKSVDFTALAKQICALVDQFTRQAKSATINQVVDILKGSKQKAIKDAGYDKLEQFNIAEDVTRISKWAKWASLGELWATLGEVWASVGELWASVGELWAMFFFLPTSLLCRFGTTFVEINSRWLSSSRYLDQRYLRHGECLHSSRQRDCLLNPGDFICVCAEGE